MQFLLAVAAQFGDFYLTCMMLPVFLVALGDIADLKYFPFSVQSKIKGNVCWILKIIFTFSC